MIHSRRAFWSPMVVGTIFGLLMLCLWSHLAVMLEKPAWVLVALVCLALLAGSVVAGYASRNGEKTPLAVRRGGYAGVFAALVAAACFALMARNVHGPIAAWRGLLIILVSLLPAILAGMVGAVLGALCFRRKAVAEDRGLELEVVLPAISLRWWDWSVIVTAALTMLLCPLFPAPFQPALRPMVSNRIPFQYTTPDALATAPASAWALQTQRLLGNLDPERAFALSRDGKFIASGNDDTISLFDLESDGVTTFRPAPFPVGAVAFNPSGARLFFVCAGDPRRIGIVEINSRKMILLPQPKSHLVPDGRVFWRSEKEVVFASKPSAMMTLNLDSLELDPAQLSQDESNRVWQAVAYPLPSNERWSIGREFMLTSAELPETDGVKSWPIQGQTTLVWKDSQQAAVRFFPKIDVAQNDRIFGSQDGSKVLRFRNGVATAFYFTTRPLPPLRWRIPMPHPPEKLRESKAATKALAMGDLSLVLYSPTVNPLTQKTVGPDREHPKAVLRVDRWIGNEAEVWIYEDYFPFTPGDVLADVHVAMNRPEILNFDQAHRWFVVAPDPVSDATDPKLLPSIAQMEKRRTEVLAKLEEEAAAAKLAAKAKQAQTTPPPVPITPQVLEPEPEPENPPEGAKILSPLEKEITAFVVEHHAKATRGEITEMVQDYAQRVDHFNNGVVDRMFIYTDEFKYHQKLTKLNEELDSPVSVKELGNGRVEARYIMSNFWRLKDGKSDRARLEIIFELEKQGGVWQITKHRATPEK